MRKRAAALCMTAVLAVTGFAGCSGGIDGEKESVRLMVWSPSEDQSKDSGEWLQNTCEDFAELHPEWDITFCIWSCRRGVGCNTGGAGSGSKRRRIYVCE